MKSVGIVRKVDQLGRVVIPKELRETFNIAINDPLEIYVEGDMIILKKYQPDCIFCGEVRDVIEYRNKTICKNCLDKLKNRLEEK